MATDCTHLYTSAPFKFIVDEQPVYIHAELVSSLSKPLSRMINGSMAEGQQGFAVMKDVDKATFTRFAQWAYRGFYKAAEFDVEKDRAKTQSEDKQAARGPNSTPKNQHYPCQGSGYCRSCGLSLEHRSHQLSQTLLKAEMKTTFANKVTADKNMPVLPPSKQDCTQNFTKVFLCHARLHVFADEYDIAALKSLAAQQLQITLANFTLYANRTGDIIALLRYVHANTGESENAVGNLRTTMMDYVGYEMDTLMKDEEFSNLLVEEGGALMKNFRKMVAKRIYLA